MRRAVLKPWVAFPSAAVVLCVVAQFVGDAGGILRGMVGLATVAVGVWALVRRHPAAAGAWALLVLGITLWVIGDAIWDWVTYRETETGATIYAADTLYLIAYPILAAGLVWLSRARGPADSRNGFLDGGILALAGALLTWTFLVEPLAGGLGLADRVIVSAYPLGDGLLVAGIAWLALIPGRRGPSLWLLMAALAIVLTDDILYNLAVRFEASETFLSWLNPWWPIGYALLVTALLHPSSAELAKPSPGAEARAHPARLTFLGIALVANAIVLVTNPAGDAMITGLSLAITGFVIARFVTLVRDNEQAHAVAAANAARFHLVASGSPVGIYEVDPDLTITFANDEGERLLGRSVEGTNARDLVAMVDQRDRGRARATVESVLAGQRSSADLRLKEHNPSERWVNMTVTPVRDEHGEVSGALASLFDITAIKRAEETLARQATHDPLTGLPNRRLLLDRLGNALRRLARTHGNVAVMFLDLDRFKLVNDLLGHDVGDSLLREVSSRLAANVRSGDTAARFGGDEFVVLVEDFESEDVLTVAAERILEAIALPMRLADNDLRVSASIGIAVAGPEDADADAVLRDADAAMYRAKELGRDRVEIFSGSEPRADAGTGPAARLPY